MPKKFKTESGEEISVMTEEEIQAQIKDATEKARKEEKDKLYTEKEKSSKEAKEAQDRLKILEKEKAELEAELEAKFKESETKKSTEELSELQKLKLQFEETQKMMKETLDSTKSQMETMTSSFKEQTESMKQQLVQEKLAKRKAELISACNGAIVEEMVSGSTEEELIASVEKAKTYYTKLQEKITDELRKNHQLPGAPKNITTEKLGDTSLDEIKNMSAVEWAKQSADLKSKLSYEGSD